LPLEATGTPSAEAPPESAQPTLEGKTVTTTALDDGQDAGPSPELVDAESESVGEADAPVARPTRSRRTARKTAPGKPAARKSTGVRATMPRGSRARKKALES
jgi:hypothetical protein